MTELLQLSGVGAKREAQFRSEGICSFRDLIYYLPRRYIDRTEISLIQDLEDGKAANFCGEIVNKEKLGGGGKMRLVLTVRDTSGELELVFFHGVRFWEKRFLPGQRLYVYGKPTFFRRLQIVHPEVEILSDQTEPQVKVVPIYSLTEDMIRVRIEHRFLNKVILEALERYSGSDSVSENVRKLAGLIPERELLRNLHSPDSMESVERNLVQLKLRELIPLCSRIEQEKQRRLRRGRAYKSTGGISQNIMKGLPFTLTPGQKQVVDLLRGFLEEPRQFFGMLQADVGAGKTLVALLGAAAVIESGYQAAFMVPTEILAMQHYRSLTAMLKHTEVDCRVLLGSTPPAERSRILRDLKAGTVQLIVGTHVLYSRDVKYRSLGLIVLDEQHRYGVQQRESLIRKGDAPDVLHMSATPIPRTLMKTVYGDMENLVLKDLPPGRMPVKTRMVPFSKRTGMYHFLLGEIAKGNQIYWVVPRIADRSERTEWSPGEQMDDEVQTLKDVSNTLRTYTSRWRVEMIHGGLPPVQKERIVKNFELGEIDLLVSTTVIEVGVDIPNAAVMVIENPDRFGMAQLHQLRGRVGRGAKQAWCFLALPKSPYPPRTMERLCLFRENQNGFVIAEMDLKLRGEGSAEGQHQSGFRSLRYTSLLDDYALVLEVRKLVEKILNGKMDRENENAAMSELP